MAIANSHLTDELYSFTTCDVLITDLDTGMELYSGTLKSHSINKTATKTAIKAGIGGITWVELEDGNDITIEIVDLRERLDMEALKLSGSMEVQTENIVLTAFPKNYTLQADPDGTAKLFIELPDTHTEVVDLNKEHGIAVYITDKEEIIPTAYIEITDTGMLIDVEKAKLDDVVYVGQLTAEDTVLVGSYKYKELEAQVIRIAADQVGANVSVTLKQPLYGPDRKVKKWRQTHFYRCSLGTEFTQESATEMAEQNTTTSFTVLKDPKHEELGFISYVDVPPAYGTSNAPFKRKNRQAAKEQAKLTQPKEVK